MSRAETGTPGTRGPIHLTGTRVPGIDFSRDVIACVYAERIT